MTSRTVIAAVFLLATASCEVDSPDPLPVCAALGCPAAPSGSAELWEPCFEAVCWCGSPAIACEVDNG